MHRVRRCTFCSHQYITKIRWSCLLADWFRSTKINYYTLLPLILFLARDMLRALSLASNFSVASRGNAATNPRNYKRHLKNVDRTSQTASKVNYDFCCNFFTHGDVVTKECLALLMSVVARVCTVMTGQWSRIIVFPHVHPILNRPLLSINMFLLVN